MGPEGPPGTDAVGIYPLMPLAQDSDLAGGLAELAQAAHNAKKQREALEAYTPKALTIALGVTAVATLASYVAYTLDHQTRAFFKSDWLWLTTVSVAFGMFRFLQLVTSRPKSESPTQEMLRDVPFVLNLVAWVVVVIVIVYALRPSGV